MPQCFHKVRTSCAASIAIAGGFIPNSDVGIGSACLWRASSGVAPELSSHTIFELPRAWNFVRRGFRRDAENHTPEARAPRYGPTFLRPTPEVGFMVIGSSGTNVQSRPRWRRRGWRKPSICEVLSAPAAGAPTCSRLNQFGRGSGLVWRTPDADHKPAWRSRFTLSSRSRPSGLRRCRPSCRKFRDRRPPNGWAWISSRLLALPSRPVSDL